MIRKVFLLTLLLIYGSGLFAQRFNGFIYSDFSGILGARVQPASIAGSPYKWDINLVNGNAFITNNIARIEPSGESSAINRYIDQKTKFLQSNLAIGGLSAMISLPNHKAMGFQYQVRGHVSANKLSPDFITQVNRFTDLRFVNSHVRDQTGELAGALWRELSFTYAAVVADDGYNRWKFGFTAKMINSYGSIFARLKDLDYNIDGNGLGLFTNFEMTYGYSANLDPYNEFDGNEPLSGLPPKNAFSSAFDVGVVFERRADRPSRKSKSGTRLEPDVDYEFRVSASLTDIGVMQFAQGEASTRILGLQPGLGADIDFDNLLSGVSSFRQLRDSVATFAETDGINGRYSVTMPTALNLNYDYNFGNDWYVNANALVDMTSLIPADFRLNYLHNLTVTPRWEQSRRAVYAPVYINQIGDFHLGLAARLGILTLGTQDLGALFASKKDSFGFFFSLNLNQLVANSKKPYCFGTTRGTSVTRTRRTPLYKRKKFLFF
jgi:hypothetical protein